MHVRWRVVFLPMCLLVLLTAALVVPLPAFIERPGGLVSLVEHVDVAADAAAGAPGEVDGDYLLTLVNVRRASLGLLVYGLVATDVVVVSAPQLTGGLDDAAYFGRQRELFSSTADVAAALGLQAAGIPVEFGEPPGALVAGVLPGAPAEGALEAGDIVTAVNGTPVRNASELVSAVRQADRPPLEVVYLRAEEERRVEITPDTVPGMDGRGLGVRVEDLQPRIDLPVAVDVDTGRIGGPSAGLMIALTVYDMVSPDDLAGGLRIAGTGGVTVQGTVTPMGGIGQKVLAAHRERAEVFLVAAEQAEEARSAVPAGSPLQVIGAATVEDAIAALDGLRRTAGDAGRLAVAA